jgi:uncharacterized protein (DUF433 family)
MRSPTAYPHIEVTAGAQPVVAGTRLKVTHIVVEHLRNVRSIDEIVRAYPPLTPAHVHMALAYYYDHQPALDRLIETGEASTRTLRRTIADRALVAKLRQAKALRARQRIA